MTLPEPLEAQLAEIASLGPERAGEPIVTAFRAELDAEPHVAELVARMTPEELRGVLNKMAWSAYYEDDPSAAGPRFQIEFNSLEGQLNERPPQLAALDAAPATAGAVGADGPELSA